MEDGTIEIQIQTFYKESSPALTKAEKSHDLQARDPGKSVVSLSSSPVAQAPAEPMA